MSGGRSEESTATRTTTSDGTTETGGAADGTATDDPPRGRLRLFGSLCGLVFMVNLARVVFAPLVEPLRRAFALSPGEAGLVVTLVWLGSALPRLPTGYLLTRVRRHRVVLGAGGVLTGAAAFTAVAPSAEWLYAGAFTMGLASGPYFLAANPLVSELFPDRVGGAIGVHGTASQVAAVGAGPLVGGVLLLADWRAAFWLIAAAAATATAAVALSARGAELPAAGSDDRDLLGAVRAQWPIVVTGVAVVGLTGFVWNGLFNFYVTYLVSEGVAESTGRDLLTVAFAAGVPAFLVTGRLADRVAYVPLLLSILAGFVVAVLVLTVTSGFWPLVAASALVGYVIHSLFPAIDTYLLDSLPDRHRASAYAVFSATMMLVQAAGSVVVGGLNDAGLTYDAIFRGLAGVLAVVVVVLAVLYRGGYLPSGARPGPDAAAEPAVAD